MAVDIRSLEEVVHQVASLDLVPAAGPQYLAEPGGRSALRMRRESNHHNLDLGRREEPSQLELEHVALQNNRSGLVHAVGLDLV